MLRPQLITFLKVCETGSFSAAAAQMYMTASAILHQVRTLEEDLGVTLFIRSAKGVELTPAGRFLLRESKALQAKSEEIRSRIRSVETEESTICVGSSAMEKCRLLYDLWMLYAVREADCEFQMLSIDSAHRIPERTDLIESINGGVPWHRQWQFLEICRVPFGIAVPENHPLAAKTVLSPADLKGRSVVTLNESDSPQTAAFVGLLRKGGANVLCTAGPEINPLLGSPFRQDLLMVPMCWADILVHMKTIPFTERIELPYGIFYRENPRPAARKFLDFVEATYGEGNENGIVPVLDGF